MRSLYSPDIDRFRDTSDAVRKHFGSTGNDKAGIFTVIPPGHLVPLRVVAASDVGWDHVSVSAAGRCPTWSEMDAIKRVFFEENETAMQLHVPPKDHVNCHPYTLHLWRPHDREIPRPPGWMV